MASDFFRRKLGNENGTWSIMVSGICVPRVMQPPHVSSQHLSREATEAIDAEADIEPIRAEIHALY